MSSYRQLEGQAESGKRPQRAQEDEVLLKVIENHKANLKRKFENISEGIITPGAETHLNKIYTELYITEGESEGVNKEHEIWQVESASRVQTTEDIQINCNDIFKPLPGQEKHIRTVMTKGVAGIGKTVSVQKFILDWADGLANQNVDFIFPLPFRELNLVRNGTYTLHNLLLEFHPELKELNDAERLTGCQLVFVFDGLDESRISLQFQYIPKVYDMTHKATVDVLMASLIQGSLLPSALIWITSRPAAASEVPSDYVDQVTEVRGFNDPQKDEYFRKRISDESLSTRIISHIKESRSLYIMCHLPVFCWIAATVLQQMVQQDKTQDIPKTLTEMFIHFLLIQTLRKKQKYQDGNEADRMSFLESQKEIIMKLAELAFRNLENGRVMFYEEDLQDSGIKPINITEASEYSGLCTKIFKEESVFQQKKVYCFVHLSIQEFLAALHVFVSYTHLMESVGTFFCLEDSLKRAVGKVLDSTNGHLDLFLRFLMGVALETNQRLLTGLLNRTHDTTDSIKETCQYIKGLNKEHLSPERCISLLQCLSEVNDDSILKEIQQYLQSPKDFKQRLSPAHCSAIAHMLLLSEKVLDEFDLKSYNTSDEGRRRLLPAVRCFRKARLNACKLSQRTCGTVKRSLLFANHLVELDLSCNVLGDSGVAAALSGHHSHLQILRLSDCELSDKCCQIVVCILKSTNSIMELDLSHNDLGDSGVELLSNELGRSRCRLQTLRLSGCLISVEGCTFLAAALTSNPSQLKQLDLNYNHPGELGGELLSSKLEDPLCKLESLNILHCAEIRLRPGVRKYACDVILDPNTANRSLSLSEENTKVLCVKDEKPYPDHPDRFDDWQQVLCREGLSGRCYWEAEWGGDGARIAAAYKSMNRKKRNNHSLVGYNPNSWTLDCSASSSTFSVWHDNKRTEVPATSSRSRRVGVYLDWPAGTLSFYSISSGTLTHLHTFHSTFTEPLYPGFRITYVDSTVSLCHIT
ncbi:NACHT, LRR and PYD domains-containing protein 3-like [Engraulis encrasicolus]|uniref:NACHT, LRR and PYD domains-containing protein 3-like n=1 Tax=Engraulis encrasicolus TaxID=184585 RepID=UPI002FD60905